MSDNKLHKIRHTLAHLMAAAVRELYPNVKLGIGPVIDNGFYYDFYFPGEGDNAKPLQISPDIFPEIEKHMRKMIEAKMPVEQIFILLEEAMQEAKLQGQKFKLELLEEIKAGTRVDENSDAEKTKDGSVSMYQIGNFTDLCKGPHVKNTKELPLDGWQLERLAGAYWRGDEKNQQMQRIYALAFENKKTLEEHLALIEEAKKRDHKKLGRELDLFVFSDLVGPGLPLWTPRGTILRNLLDDFVWQLRQARGYQKVEIPHIAKQALYETSGHWNKFQDQLFKVSTREGHTFAMKPMNCPHHTQIYARRQHSYKELPQRYANTTMCYRDEQTGELSGLSRLRSFTQDDAHVFCRLTQIEEEANKIWDIINEFYRGCGFPQLNTRLSLHDPAKKENYLGDSASWEKAEDILRLLAKHRKVRVDEAISEAAFYGPKIDCMAHDSLGRELQVATIQLDLNMPERFDLTCTNEEGKAERIVMLHATIMGSIERFMSVLIEHHAGAFPLWLAPVQATIVSISDKFNKYANKAAERLRLAGLRIEINERNESVGKKIREAEMQKVPYILVVGEKEQKAKSVAVRQRGVGDLGMVKIESLAKQLTKEVAERA